MKGLDKNTLKTVYHEIASSVGINKEFPSEFSFWQKHIASCTTFNHEMTINNLRMQGISGVPESRLDIVCHKVSSPKNVAASALYRSHILYKNSTNDYAKIPVVVNPFYATTSMGNSFHWEGEARRVAEKLATGAIASVGRGVFLQSHHRFNLAPNIYNHSLHQVLSTPVVAEMTSIPSDIKFDKAGDRVSAICDTETALSIQQKFLESSLIIDGFSACDCVAPEDEVIETGDVRGLYKIVAGKNVNINGDAPMTASIQVTALTQDGKLILSSPALHTNEKLNISENDAIEDLAVLVSKLQKTFEAKSTHIVVDNRDILVKSLKNIASLVQEDPMKRIVRPSIVSISAVPIGLTQEETSILIKRPFCMSSEMVFREIWKNKMIAK